MPEPFATAIGQFSASGGQVAARAANVRAVEPAADLPGAERGNLYMLIEVTGSGGGHAALYREMLNAAQTAFYEAGGGVESALVRAVRAAHLVLARANEALPEAQWRAGATFAALSGPVLTIAQCGPAFAVVSHPKEIEQFPYEVGEWGVPLGSPERPEITTGSTTAEAGSMLLLAQSDWLDVVSAKGLAVAAAADSVELARDYLGHIAGEHELSALLVGFGSHPIPEVTEPDAKPAAAAAAVAATGTKPAGGGGLRGLFGMSRGAKVRAEEPVAEPSQAVSRPPGPVPVAEPEMISYELDQPAPPAYPAAPPLEMPPKRSPWPILLALVVIPALIGLLVLFMWWMRAPRVEAQVRRALDGAETVLNDVTTIQDESAARQRLSGARDFLEEARTKRPQDQRLAALQKRYDELNDRLFRITPLYGIVPLWSFTGPNQSLQRVVAAGDSLFVLDRGQHQIFRFILSQLRDSVTPTAQPVIAKGQTVGDIVVSDLVDMTWSEASGNQRSKLLALDTASNLVGYDVQFSAGKVPIAGKDKWGKPELLAGYGGNLYVVDAGNDQIWRYRPGGEGFEKEPEPYFAPSTQIDLADIQSVSIDGNVWLLFPDGRLLKLLVGEQQPFALNGLPDPMGTPTAVVAPLEGDRLYIADPGNARILEFTKDGQFQRQLKAREGEMLRDIRSLYLDEAAGVFYILTGDQLYKADVPEVAATPTTTTQ